jgi:hypothetical protein
MTDAHRSSTPAAHAAHDLSTVAALAARAHDLDDATTASARRQVAECTACADVLADLLTLQTVLPTTSTPTRPRDFRLTPADAARLHRTGWRRFLGFFGSARDGFSRPLAIGFTTLGLAGLLVATVPTLYMGAGGAASGPSEVLAPVGNALPAASAAPSAAASMEAYSSERIGMEAPAGAGGAEPADSVDGGVFSGAEPGVTDIAGDLAIRDDATGLSALFVLGGVLLIAGLGLFGLRWSARRLL